MRLLLTVVYCFNKRSRGEGSTRKNLNHSFMIEVNLLNVLSPGFVISAIDLPKQVPSSVLNRYAKFL